MISLENARLKLLKIQIFAKLRILSVAKYANLKIAKLARCENFVYSVSGRKYFRLFKSISFKKKGLHS